MISLLGGDDDYQIELEIEALLGSARRRGAPFFEAEYEPDELDRVFGHLSSPSLFAADPPIALLRDADRALAKEPTERILAWEKGGPQGLLVLVAPSAEKKSENAVVKACAKAGRIRILSRPQRPADWIRWIRSRAERFGLEIDEEAARLLHQRVGEAPGPIDRELEKIGLLGEKRIDRATLAEMVGGHAEAKVFEACDAYFRGNPAPLLAALPELTEHGRAVVRFIGAFQYVAERNGETRILADLARLDQDTKSRDQRAHLARVAVYLRRASERISKGAA